MCTMNRSTVGGDDCSYDELQAALRICTSMQRKVTNAHSKEEEKCVNRNIPMSINVYLLKTNCCM